ncbi:MAG: cell division protein FtsA [Patescibacteria group bacterium]|nr:cell division protein FtsA [Patescibacteria group bacterium]
MLKNEYIIAIDIGSSHIRTVVAQVIAQEENKPRIVGVGVVLSSGIRRGIVADIEEVTESIGKSIEDAQRNSGVKIENAYVSIGGAHIKSVETKGVIAVGMVNGEVSPEDIERATEAAQAINLPPNKEILHLVPQSYCLDDQEDIKDPLGMIGVRLEVRGLIIFGSTSHIRNITKCVNNNGIEVEGFVISPLAAAKAVLNKRQKELGVVCIDIGSETTSLAVYEERELIHIAVLPIGAGHITNDIAIGLRTSIDVAEKVKLKYGSALSNEISKRDQINLADFDPNEEGIISRRHVAEIIEARLEEIFYMVEKELKKINRSALLPAGAVLTGGGACMQGSVDLAKDILKLPVQTGFPIELSGLIDKVDSPVFSVTIGMILWAFEDPVAMANNERTSNIFSKKDLISKMSSIKGDAQTIKKWFGKFLP